MFLRLFEGSVWLLTQSLQVLVHGELELEAVQSDITLMQPLISLSLNSIEF